MDLVSTIHDSYEDKLDRLLRHLISHDKLFVSGERGQVDLYYARRTIGVSQADFEELCQFLADQHYLDLFKNDKKELTNIRITLNGRHFIKPDGSGGYKAQRLKETNEKSLRLLAKWLIVIGSFSALGLLIAEIWHIWHHLRWE